MEEIRVPNQAKEIIEKLMEHGYEAYVVGGCVRDSLLGRAPGDWDITTSAKPQQVKALFGRTIDTGIQHGTVTIMRGRTGYEVTTYRIDGEYEDGRHPKSVEFTSSLTEDLKRRDFTINAMAYNPKTGLVDEFEGIRDLEKKRIRCVGNPLDRFSEDALRILRAIRFSAQLGFEIELETRQALRVIAPNLIHVSKERIQTELTKLLLSDYPDHIKMVFEDGIAPYICPSFTKLSPEKIAVSTMLSPKKHLRWASLLRHLSAEDAAAVLKELKLDNDTIDRVKRLVGWWRQPAGLDETEIRKTMSQMAPDEFDDLLMVKLSVAGQYCKAEAIPAYDQIPESPADLEKLRQISDAIRKRGDCVSLKNLAVTGNDLISLGMKPGRDIGKMLNLLLQTVLEHPEKNERELLLAETNAFLSQKFT